MKSTGFTGRCRRAQILERSLYLLFVFSLSVPACLAADPASGQKPGISWSIDPPASPWNIRDSRWAEFAVTISPNAADTKVKVSHSTIVDSDTGRGASVSAGQFHVCPAKDVSLDKCDKNFAIPKSEKRQFGSLLMAMYQTAALRAISTLTPNRLQTRRPCS
jgi:hypothetical protein